MAYVTATAGDGKTLEQFARLIQERQRWLHENAENSVAAVVMEARRSQRAGTDVAKPEKAKPKVEPTPLVPSVTSQGGKKVPCLRAGRARYTPPKDVRVIWADPPKMTTGVWKFEDDFRGGKAKIYLIVAASQHSAQERAKAIVQSRIRRFAGLARKALSLLMKKTFNGKGADEPTTAQAAQKADELTSKTETRSGGQYSLCVSDMLDYAKLALRGGGAAVETALQKAVNKATSQLNYKCRDLLLFKKLETPFPEVATRRR